MDNLTHSLIGITAVEWADAFRKEKWTAKQKLPLFVASIVANNLPDIDFVYSGITGGKLSYLLHHRGHTHTLLGAIAVVLPMLFILIRFAKKRNESKSVVRAIWGFGILGVLLHLFADYWNSYGIHPFWPLDKRWYFGDSIFIIEPFLWLSLLPLAITSFLPKLLRWGLAAMIPVGWGLMIVSKAVPTVVVGFLVVWPIILTLWFRRGRRDIAVHSMLIVSGVFIALSFALSQYIKKGLRQADPDIVDIVLTPMPANPVCWVVITISELPPSVTSPQGEIRYLRGVKSTLPNLVDPKNCPRIRGIEATTTAFYPVQLVSDRSLYWESEVRLSLVKFKELAKDHCEFTAFLKFSRTPFWVDAGPGEKTIGDLRFDWDKQVSFAEMSVKNIPEKCPAFVPDWQPPRSDWLK